MVEHSNPRTCLVCGEYATVGLQVIDGQDFEYNIKGTWRFLQCNSCGVWILDPFPTVKQLLKYYPAQYHSYNRPESFITRTLWRLTLRQKTHYLKKLIPSGARFLEIGCADGHVIRELERRGGWKGSGIEFKDEIAELGRKRGTDIRTGTLEEVSFSVGQFDLIVMDHLLEHVTNPEVTMRTACQLLKPGGYIVGNTPNTASWDAAFAGRYWGGLHTPRHLFLMNPKNLSRLAERTGFNVIEVLPSLHTGHWAGSAQNFFERKTRGEHLRQGRAFYFPLLLMLFIPVNAIQCIFKKTGVIGFTFQKRV